MDVHIRWMIRRDFCDVLDIENEAFEFPWSEDELVRYLRCRNAIGMVAEDVRREKVVGFMVYELHKSKLHVANFAVHKDYRRQGIGRALFAKLIAKLWPTRRTRILLEVRESNLDAQLFFRSIGCRCIGTLRGHYDDTDEDAYVMQYRYKAQTATEETCSGR